MRIKEGQMESWERDMHLNQLKKDLFNTILNFIIYDHLSWQSIKILNFEKRVLEEYILRNWVIKDKPSIQERKKRTAKHQSRRKNYFK
jgi:hypothetical protein